MVVNVPNGKYHTPARRKSRGAVNVVPDENGSRCQKEVLCPRPTKEASLSPSPLKGGSATFNVRLVPPIACGKELPGIIPGQ